MAAQLAASQEELSSVSKLFEAYKELQNNYSTYIIA
jgi:hypothetical protein